MSIVVFSNSETVIRYVKRYNVNTLPITKANAYGMPILKWMLLEIRSLFDCSQIIYVNSDILINPYVFDTAYRVSSIINEREVAGYIYCIIHSTY